MFSNYALLTEVFHSLHKGDLQPPKDANPEVASRIAPLLSPMKEIVKKTTATEGALSSKMGNIKQLLTEETREKCIIYYKEKTKNLFFRGLPLRAGGLESARTEELKWLTRALLAEDFRVDKGISASRDLGIKGSARSFRTPGLLTAESWSH